MKPIMVFIGGCEFLSLIQHLQSDPDKYFPFNGWYSYLEFGETDPYLIVQQRLNGIAEQKPDVIIISQMDKITYTIRNIQFNQNNSKEELDQQLNEIVTQCEEMIDRLSGLSAPIMLQYFPWARTKMLNSFETRPGTYNEVQFLRKYITAMEELALKYSNLYFMDLSGICAFYGYYQILRTTDKPWSTHIVYPAEYIADEFARWINYILRRDKKVKCVLVDLDNTMWHGVIRDVGIENIQVRPFIERFRWEVLRVLYSRGILIGVVSKNDPYIEPQIRSFAEQHLWGAKLACMELSWQDKWQAVKKIQQELNIGDDSILFIDDSEFERTQMKTMLPEVRVCDENIFEELLYLPELQPEFVTEESKKRTDYYLQDKKRKTVSQKVTAEQFLQQCQFKVNIEKMQPCQVSRVAELIQRTNQLNTSIKRYTQSQIVFFSRDHHCDIFTVTVSDKFGDYGLVGVCIGFHKSNVYEIDTLLFSCRVMSKGVEDYTLTSVLNYAANRNFDKVILRFKKGPKNNQMRTILSKNNFVESTADDDCLVYNFALKLQQIKPFPKWFSSADSFEEICALKEKVLDNDL